MQPSEVSQFPSLNLRYTVTDANRVKVVFASSSFEHAFHYALDDFVALLGATGKGRNDAHPTASISSEKLLKEGVMLRSVAPFWWRCLLRKDTDLIVLMEQRALAGRMTNDGCVVNLMLKSGSVVKCAANISCNDQVLPNIARQSRACLGVTDAGKSNSKETDSSPSYTKTEKKLKPESYATLDCHNLVGFSASLSYAFVPIPHSVKLNPSHIDMSCSAAETQTVPLSELSSLTALTNIPSSLNLPSSTPKYGNHSFDFSTTPPSLLRHVSSMPYPYAPTTVPGQAQASWK